MKTMQKGFTLIELMIVIAIIGILASVAIPQYQNYIARSEVQTSLGDVRGLTVAIEDYAGRYGILPADEAALLNYNGFNYTFKANISTQAKYEVAVEDNKWAIAVKFLSGASSLLNQSGKETYTITPVAQAATTSVGNESVKWTVTSTLPTAFQPKL